MPDHLKDKVAIVTGAGGVGPGCGNGRAAVVLYCASEEARFITATEIIAAGGIIARCD